MLNKVKRLMKSLRRNISGNVLILFAAGAPVFIGGAGLAVDTAQWYMWKREMQYAVDQAAMAGAWSRVGGTTGTEYQTRARQELTANLQVVNFQGTPSVSLADYSGQTNNSVLVSLSATRQLPFSKLVMGSGATITVSAQAAFEKANAFTACLIAVDPSTSGAITFRGNAYLVARCGVAALSNSATAIVNGGNGTFNVGYLVSAGQIDDSLAGTFVDPHTGLPYTNVAFEGQSGLVDPFGELTPPNNPTPQTYACSSTTTYTASTSTVTTIVDKVYTSTTSSTGPWTLSQTNAVSSATTTGSEAATATTRRSDILQDTNSTVTGSVVTVPGSAAVPASGCNKLGKNCSIPAKPATSASYKRTDRYTTVKKTVTSVSSTSTPSTAAMQPGTYSTFTVSCNTTMAKGVYVINGGQFKVNAQDSVSGAGVMIVLKNGASISINGGSTLNLRAMSTTEMISAGISESEALKLKDMLIFEDRNSTGAGASGDTFNGNAGAVMEGTIYLPKSNVNFNGTFGVVSRCLVIAARTIDIGGTANMSSFCPAGTTDHTGGVSIGGGAASVRLVA